MAKKYVACLLGLAILGTAGLAQAVPYVGVAGGLITLSSGMTKMFDALDNLDGLDGKLFVGNFWGPSRGMQYGLEADGMYFSHANFSLMGLTTAYRGYALSGLAAMRYVFQSGFFLVGKGGGAYLYENNKNTLTFNGTTLTLSNESGSKLAPELAFGLGYQFTPKVEMDLSADSIFAGRPYSNSKNPVAQTNTINLGLSYHFA